MRDGSALKRWPFRAHSQVLRKTDPLHQLYFKVKHLEGLDDRMRTHLLLVLAKYLPIGNQDIVNRMFIRAALNCYVQTTILEDQLWDTQPGSAKYRDIAAQTRAWYEAMAKCYRLKGIDAPGRKKKPGAPGASKPITFTAEPSAASEPQAADGAHAGATY